MMRGLPVADAQSRSVLRSRASIYEIGSSKSPISNPQRAYGALVWRGGQGTHLSIVERPVAAFYGDRFCLVALDRCSPQPLRRWGDMEFSSLEFISIVRMFSGAQAEVKFFISPPGLVRCLSRPPRIHHVGTAPTTATGQRLGVIRRVVDNFNRFAWRRMRRELLLLSR